jgi:signal transduction histidine kinase/ActR/RegA family two-component response regulator
MANVLRDGELISCYEETPSPVLLHDENGTTSHHRDRIALVRWTNVLPLFARGQLAGALLLAYESTRNYTDNDLALAKEVASRTSIALENSLLYREIQNGDRRKNEFLAMLAHELRNPLAPMRNAVHIIDALQLGNSTLDWAAQIIGDQVTHIARIVDDLLDVARIARGKVELRSELLTLSSILRHSLETSRPLIDMRRQQLNVELPSDDFCVRGDIVRLAQVFSNLLNNASKYNVAGGSIWLKCQRNHDQVIVSVRDNGAGIAAELLPDIFELFRQGAQPIDRTQGGLGVGLTLVKQLVEMHGGSVQAKSLGMGRGAEFIVQLPLSIVSATEHNATIPDNSPVASKAASIPRILIVDDQKSTADSLRRIFEMKGFSAEVAYDGPSALLKAAQFNPETVVLDIGLPGMDGFELARAMKELRLPSDPFLIALTGYGQSEDVQRALSSGFDIHLVKPVDIPYLFSLISERQFVRMV